jgi:hypothetical protein
MVEYWASLMVVWKAWQRVGGMVALSAAATAAVMAARSAAPTVVKKATQ